MCDFVNVAHAAHIKTINDLEKTLFEDGLKEFDTYDHSPAFGTQDSMWTMESKFDRLNIVIFLCLYFFQDFTSRCNNVRVSQNKCRDRELRTSNSLIFEGFALSIFLWKIHFMKARICYSITPIVALSSDKSNALSNVYCV